MSKYTPCPWKTKLQRHKSGRLDIGILHQEDTKRWIARITDQPGIEIEEDLANAERIVACVNACEGIDPTHIPELLRALQQHVDYTSGPGLWFTPYRDEIIAAFKKVKNDPEA